MMWTGPSSSTLTCITVCQSPSLQGPADKKGNGTQALVMPLNAASNAEDIAIKAGKPPTSMRGRDGARRRGWKGFYGSVHDIVNFGLGWRR